MGVSREQFFELDDNETEAYIDAWDAREERENARVARLCLSMFASQGAKKKGGRPFELRDFLPKKPLTPEQQAALTEAKLCVLQGQQKALERQKKRQLEQTKRKRPHGKK